MDDATAAALVHPTLAETSICLDCAKAKGGRAPEDGVATFWTAFCIVCGKAMSCTHVRDFRWPGGVRPTRTEKAK